MMKRVFDVCIAAVLLLLSLPVIVVAAIVTAVSLRTWPFFMQDRIGKDGRRFKFIKLRTLPTHAPRYAGKYELASLRLPRFSLLMRRIHLDELPQLVLVLVGKMSMVGPRPEMPYLHEEMDPAFAAMRTSLRPGCTGLWQVSVDCGAMIYERPEYDEFYVHHRSLRLDAWILWRTARMVIPYGQNSLISLEQLPKWARPAPVSSAPTPVASEPVRSHEPVLQGADG